jgi:hypothetical protein
MRPPATADPSTNKPFPFESPEGTPLRGLPPIDVTEAKTILLSNRHGGRALELLKDLMSHQPANAVDSVLHLLLSNVLQSNLAIILPVAAGDLPESFTATSRKFAGFQAGGFLP